MSNNDVVDKYGHCFFNVGHIRKNNTVTITLKNFNGALNELLQHMCADIIWNSVNEQLLIKNTAFFM